MLRKKDKAVCVGFGGSRIALGFQEQATHFSHENAGLISATSGSFAFLTIHLIFLGLLPLLRHEGQDRLDAFEKDTMLVGVGSSEAL